jgi:MoaA/NifB/PqqE/SkfB family radical SAM enzyme|tara:strand:+ start:200 stop:1249 length:1050 start_codon:yes stop_codon:yes gene_type:complete
MSYCSLPFKQVVMKNFDGNGCSRFLPCNHILKSEVEDACTVRPMKGKLNLTPEEGFGLYQDVRDSMMKGERPELCKVCWDKEDKGKTSYRQKIDKFVEDSEKFVIDINCGNVCNLACRMCAPGLSRKLKKDYNYFVEHGLDFKTPTDDFFTIDLNPDPINSLQWKWITENTDKIGGLKLAGGEPLVNKSVISLFRKMVSDGISKDINLSFYTNGLEISNHTELLNQFKGVYANFSVEAIGELYHYIRYPGIFEDFDFNVKYFMAKSTNLKDLAFNVVVSVLNVLDLDSLKEWLPTDNVGYVNVFPEDRGISVKHLWKDREKVLSEILLFDKSRNQNYKDFLHPDLVKWL